MRKIEKLVDDKKAYMHSCFYKHWLVSWTPSREYWVTTQRNGTSGRKSYGGRYSFQERNFLINQIFLSYPRETKSALGEERKMIKGEQS